MPPGAPWPGCRIEFPPELPISARAEEIVNAIAAHPVLILAGETGSGKTTQIPKLCLAAGRGTLGRIACTQPRRVAALSLSRRVAEEMNATWGREVGCKVRFSDDTTPQTVIKFMTDGMLLAEAQADPLLGAYDTIVIDEAHERSLNIDFLLGHLRQLRHRRPELRIIITSATIDTESFRRAFDDAPVIIVEGKMFPVEVVYAPLDSLGSDAIEGEDRRAEAMHYVDGAVEAAERAANDGPGGDILIFMPSERDIRETCELLAPRLRSWEILPLFGRLTNEEQRRVFSPGSRRRVVVATNIAETSLTLPRIRAVVDTGLVRLSRYSPQGRTRRLPIEPISQSSADQRKGRCGRVAEGVCIRLYSEEDFRERPRYTQPEIQRANLADVILRLKATGLGDVERFPFIDAPSTKAVRSGYALLEEVGAIEQGADHALTPLGRELAQLPVDPTVGRMILQARREKATREVLVIASGLSIQDPRERPQEKRAQADQAHRKFAHPDSDFLTLLAIWEAYHGDVERMSQGRLRAFCREHHLSYLRMREWRDVHDQLAEVVGGGGRRQTSVHDGLKPGAERSIDFGTPAYRAIHRSILAGLLGNIAVLDDEAGDYKAAHGRRVHLFPGSTLFRPGAGRKPGAAKGPRWIMAAEITETTRVYARTCARLDPAWALELCAHVASISHSEPFWNEKDGRAMVKQRTRLYGLEIDSRSVGLSKIDPAKATEILIREGLVNDTITWPFDFVAHNRRLRESVEAALTRTRDSGYLGLDEAAYRFYAARITNTGSVAELVALVRERRGAEPRFLMMEEADLRGPEEVDPADSAQFPATVAMDNRVLPLHYAYKPGMEDDGVTVDVNVRDAAALAPSFLDWAVPGHLAQKVEHALRSLPKDTRRLFMPVGVHAQRLTEAASRLRDGGFSGTLAEALSEAVRTQQGIAIDPAAWTARPLPDHLRLRLRVVDDRGKELAAGRDVPEVLATLDRTLHRRSAALSRQESGAWASARARHEQPAQQTWGFGTLPGKIAVSEEAGVPVFAYPGFHVEPKGVALRLYHREDEARAGTAEGLRALLALALQKDLAWLHKDLGALSTLGAHLALLRPAETLREQAHAAIRASVCAVAVEPLSREGFEAAVAAARTQLRTLVPGFIALVREVAMLRGELMVEKSPYPGLAADLERLCGPDFLTTTPYAQLRHLPRFLKAMKLRAAKRRQNPARDDERTRELAPIEAAAAGRGEDFRWLLEEFRVSLFAQELGTAVPVSAVRLRQALAGDAPAAAQPRPAAPAEIVRPKPATLKTLSALGSALRPPGS